jgi:hypothetical protein
MNYLASPYSHPDPTVRQQRFAAACAATAVLLRAGHQVFAPVVHGHPLTTHGIPGDWSFWEPQARWLIERCDELVVLTIDGWQDSVGVQAELQHARDLQKPVRYIDSETP